MIWYSLDFLNEILAVRYWWLFSLRFKKNYNSSSSNNNDEYRMVLTLNTNSNSPITPKCFSAVFLRGRFCRTL